MKMPSYKAVERAINVLLENLGQIFSQVLGLCDQLGLIGRERGYTGGPFCKAGAGLWRCRQSNGTKRSG